MMIGNIIDLAKGLEQLVLGPRGKRSAPGCAQGDRIQLSGKNGREPYPDDVSHCSELTVV